MKNWDVGWVQNFLSGVVQLTIELQCTSKDYLDKEHPILNCQLKEGLAPKPI